MAELFEGHDKGKFEIYGFSFGPDTNDAMRKRVAAAFFRFIDVRRKSDREVASLSRSLGIDIAVDLKGYTQDTRLEIFAERCAPVQVSYLGYPGTLGTDFIDYVIADPVRGTVPSDAWINVAKTILTKYNVAVNPVMIATYQNLWPSRGA